MTSGPRWRPDYLSHLLGGTYIGGPAVTSFEEQWAAYCETDYAVGVANGTDALELTLTALGDRPWRRGQWYQANAFIAAAAAVVRVGAVPHFADVGDETLLMTPDTLSRRALHLAHVRSSWFICSDKCRIWPVFSLSPPKAGIFVIEDGAQAHGAEWDG